MNRMSDDDFKVAIRQAATRLDLHLMAARLYLDEVFTRARTASAHDIVDKDVVSAMASRVDDAFDDLLGLVVRQQMAAPRKRGRLRKAAR